YNTTATKYLEKYFTNASAITKSIQLKDEKKGIDFFVCMNSGKKIKVDAKFREKGASIWWKNGEEELALEIWSIKPKTYYNFTNLTSKQQLGWTLDDSKETDYILYVFNEADSKNIFIFDFELLKNALQAHGREWIKQYKHVQQRTNAGAYTWVSEVVFVPISVVQNAINPKINNSTYLFKN
ncbi:unnamed protein product, partial [marine sediment metagenome]